MKIESLIARLKRGSPNLPIALVAAVGSILLFAVIAVADPISPTVSINTNGAREFSSNEVYSGVKLAFFISSLTFLPALVMSATCFTRIAIVLSLTRQALGTAQTPPNQVLLGLSLFLTFAVMGPIFNEIYSNALQPFADDQITHQEFFQRAFEPLKGFMLRHTREQDLSLFIDITKSPIPEAPEQLGAAIIIPSFVISELNSAFQIAFLIYVPFLILDMIISSVLTSMSMITLPPTIISLPIKLMLFVVIDGWHLIIGNLVKSYHE